MYKIFKITNNTDDTVYFTITRKVSFLLFWEIWETKTTYLYDFKTPRQFNSYMSALLWVRSDLKLKKFKQLKTLEGTIISLKDVEDTIDNILKAQTIETDRINNLTDAEYYKNN